MKLSLKNALEEEVLSFRLRPTQDIHHGVKLTVSVDGNPETALFWFYPDTRVISKSIIWDHQETGLILESRKHDKTCSYIAEES